MKLLNTHLADCFIIEPTIFVDERGYFFESFNEHKFCELAGFAVHFVQDNQSYRHTEFCADFIFRKANTRRRSSAGGERAKFWTWRLICGRFADLR